MLKFYVKWDFTDFEGRAYEDYARFDWFDSEEEAKAFVDKKKKGNGGYFKLWKIGKGDYEVYEKMNFYYAEYAKLKRLLDQM